MVGLFALAAAAGGWLLCHAGAVVFNEGFFHGTGRPNFGRRAVSNWVCAAARVGGVPMARLWQPAGLELANFGGHAANCRLNRLGDATEKFQPLIGPDGEQKSP